MQSKSSREIGRLLAFFALYIYDLDIAELSELKTFSWYPGMSDFDDEWGLLPAVTSQKKREIFKFARELLMGTIGNLERVDLIIRRYLVKWDFERLHPMDKAILREAVYSLLYCFDIPSEVTIYQANELASEYSDEQSYKYINGILHSVKTQFRRNFLVSNKKKAFVLKKKKK